MTPNCKPKHLATDVTSISNQLPVASRNTLLQTILVFLIKRICPLLHHYFPILIAKCLTGRLLNVQARIVKFVRIGTWQPQLFG